MTDATATWRGVHSARNASVPARRRYVLPAGALTLP